MKKKNVLELLCPLEMLRVLTENHHPDLIRRKFVDLYDSKSWLESWETNFQLQTWVSFVNSCTVGSL